MEAAAAISRAVPQSSAAAGMPGTPSLRETSPSCIRPPEARYKSSQWAVTVSPKEGACSRASSRRRVFTTGLPSSLRAMAPASFKAARSASSFPCKSLVTQAAVYTAASAVWARSSSARTVSGESMAGLVLGMASRLVTPPAAAARQPEYTSSLWVRPGSRRWTCISTRPGAATRPVPSTTWAFGAARLLPSWAILPSSSSRSITSSSPWEGSMTRAF